MDSVFGLFIERGSPLPIDKNRRRRASQGYANARRLDVAG
jgi:hypothetical protein